jgi:Rieske Fe-S protein
VALGRRLLLKVGCGVVCLGAVGCDEEATLPRIMDAGNASAVTLGTLSAIEAGPAAIGKDAAGIYALSLVCTHSGCDIRSGGQVSAGEIVCGCHGSVFDAQGAVIEGPATEPLPHLTVTEDATGELTIHGDEPAAVSTRI